MNEDKAGDAGFSTVEVIVAFTILALVLGAATQSVVISARSLSVAKQRVGKLGDLRHLVVDPKNEFSGVLARQTLIETDFGNVVALGLQLPDQHGRSSTARFLTFRPAEDSDQLK